MSASELCSMDFPEPEWVVHGILPEGLNLLAGKPKKGKSWLALNVAVSIATGKDALGSLGVKRGSVLYLALEDNNRRLKQRLSSVLGEETQPDNLRFGTSWPKLDAGGVEKIEKWIHGVDSPRLVIVDTLAKVRPAKKGGSGVYADDYEACEGLKKLADKYAITILVVHHLSKREAADIFDTVSGSTGLTGAADAIQVLDVGKGMADATLHVTGRDLEQQELALKFDQSTTSWKLLGKAENLAKTRERQEILDLLARNGAMHYTDIVSALKKNSNTIRGLLSKMVKDGELYREEEGTYNHKQHKQVNESNKRTAQTEKTEKQHEHANSVNTQTA